MADMKNAVSYDQLIAELAGLVATGRTGTLYITSTENRAVRFQLQDGEIVTCFFGPKQGVDALHRINSIAGGTFRFDPKAAPLTADRTLPPTDVILASLGYAPSRSALGFQAAVASPPLDTIPAPEPEPSPVPPPVLEPPTDQELEEMYLETTGLHEVLNPAPADPSLEEMFMETTGLYDVAAAAAAVEVPRSEFALAVELVTLEFACFVGPVANAWTMSYVVQNGAPHSGPELRALVEAMAGEIQAHDRRKVRSFIQRVRQRLAPIL